MADIDDALRNCFPAQGPIAEYMAWAHRLTHAPPAIHLACALPLVSYELVRRGFALPVYDTLTVWLGVIAPPASAKTTALGWMRRFSQDWYESLYGEQAPQPWVSLNGSMQGILHAISEREDSRLSYIPGVLYHTEAHKIFFAEEAPSVLCELYDGHDYERNYRYIQRERGTNGASKVTIKNPRLSAILTTTRAAIEQVMRKEILEGGLFSRVLWLQERIDQAQLQPRPLVDEDGRLWLLQRWQAWARALDGYHVSGLRPEILLDAEALRFLEQTLFDAMRPYAASEHMESSIALRVMPHAARIAAVYAASRLNVVRAADGLRIMVDLDDLVRAANFVLRSFASALDLGGHVSATRADLATRRARVLEMVQRAGRSGISKRDVYGLFHGHLPKRDIDSLLAELVDCEAVVEARVPAVGSRGGRPGSRFFAISVWEEIDRDLAQGGTVVMQ